MVWLTSLLAMVAASCAHEAPLAPGVYTPGRPATSGPIVRLTFNPGADLAPAWLPDGSGFLYTRERLDRRDRDRCLALVPAAGGSIAREICNNALAAEDSVNAYGAAAADLEGRLVYVRASAPIGFGWPLAPLYHEFVLASLADPRRASVLEAFPVFAPNGRTHDEAAQIRWLDDHTLIYLAQSVQYVPPCSFCPPDTVTVGLEIARVDLGGPAPVLSVLPGTDQASSVAVGGSDTVYFTVYNDSRVFRLALGSGALEVAHDFGGLVARDVQVSGRRMAAVVGGSVEYVVDSVRGPIVRDHGGEIRVVDLQSGNDQTLLVTNTLFRHLALDPSGRIVIAEGYPIEIVMADTTFSPVGDLWRFELP